VLVAGRDRSGRKFPFALFTGVAPGGAAPGALLRGLAPFLDRAESEARRVLEVEEAAGPAPMRPVAEAVAALAGVEIVVGTEPPAWPPLAGWSGPDGGGAARVVARAGANLLEVAIRVGAAEGKTPAYGLRLPIPAESPEAPAWTRFWVELAGRSFGAPRALFWSESREDGAGVLDLYFRPPGTTAFLHLVDPDLDTDSLYPLFDQDPPHAGPAARSWAAAVEEVAGRDGATLGDVLGLGRGPA